VEWLVRFFNLLDPHVQRVKFLFNEVIEVIRSVEDTVDGSHQEREEGQSHELKSNRENILFWGASWIITVSDCCNDLENPVESKNVLSVITLVTEVISVSPRLSAVLLHVVAISIVVIVRWVESAIRSKSNNEPDTSHDVTQVNDVQNETSETRQVILSLLWVFLEHTLQKKVERISQLWEMDNSEDLQNVVFHDFTHEQFW